MKKNLNFLLVTLAITAVFLLALKTYEQAQANVSDNFSGWAWSDNVGWVSFNCTNGGPTNNDICATSSYGVTKDASGNLSGYAWSDNVGWISFKRADTGNPPSNDVGSGTGAIAKLSGSNLLGWARALAGIPGTTDNTGGWDGWISFAGTATDNSPYGITLNNTTREYEGFSWGSNVIGWLTFNPFGVIPSGGGGNTGGCSTNCGGGVVDGSPQTLGGGSCNITSGSATPAKTTSVTWTAGSTGGTVPLTYTWTANCSQGASSNPTPATLLHTFTASSETCAPTVSIKDSATPQQTVNVICAVATVPASGTLTATLAGRPASARSSQSYLSTVNLRTGSSVAFKADVSSSVGTLTCNLIGKDRNQVTIETISPSGSWIGTNLANSKSLPASGSPYTYTLSCQNGISPDQTSTVTIKVVNNPIFQEF